MNILFTICGRAGSKGCKNKNMKEFLGSPLLYFTISCIDIFKKTYKEQFGAMDICVNSDSLELLDLVKKVNQNIELINRDASLAGDSIGKVDVIKNSVDIIEDRLNNKYDLVIDLDITSPLRVAHDVKRAIDEKLRDRDKNVVFSVVPSRRNPYFNMVQDIEGDYKMIIESTYLTRQEAPQTYDMNASIYVYEREALRDEKLKTLFEGACGAITMTDTAVLDIDSEEDFELMQVVAEHFMSKNSEMKAIIDNIKEIV
ncbi:MAG: acylneuraminate cytidylyltransferase family protein [Clostridium sp.]